MIKTKEKTEKRQRRKNRIRAKVVGTSERPRFAVFKSNKAISAQLIDDVSGKTLVASTSLKISGKDLNERSKNVGLDIAKKALDKKISTAVFDRGGYIFTGNIKVLADGAREGGLKF